MFTSAILTSTIAELISLQHFRGAHPAVMQERVRHQNWRYDHDMTRNRYRLKDKLKQVVFRLTGYRIGEYRNYQLI